MFYSNFILILFELLKSIVCIPYSYRYLFAKMQVDCFVWPVSVFIYLSILFTVLHILLETFLNYRLICLVRATRDRDFVYENVTTDFRLVSERLYLLQRVFHVPRVESKRKRKKRRNDEFTYAAISSTAGSQWIGWRVQTLVVRGYNPSRSLRWLAQ